MLITNYGRTATAAAAKTYLANLVEALQNKGADVSVLFREGDDPEHFWAGGTRNAKQVLLLRLHSWQHHSYDPAIVEQGE